MPKKKSYITVKDQFCGAGGSTQGAVEAGAEVLVAMNHWKLATETYNTNNPNTRVYCADVSASDPRWYPSTDVLVTSPECTKHSPGSGIKTMKRQMDLFTSGKLDPAAERSRATMWDVVRFSEYHNYSVVIVENVVEVRKWQPYDSWLRAMYSLGYVHKSCFLNSMHFHPTPQSRDRTYIVFWKKGNKAPNLDYTPIANCPRCTKDVLAVQTWKKPDVRYGKYRQQYVYCCPSCTAIIEPYYYAAFNAIDWSDIGTRIGDRPKDLSPNTITRAKHGLQKYGSSPFQVVNYTPGYSKAISDSLGAITTQDHHGICSPFIIKLEHSQRADNSKSLADSGMTQTARQSQMIVSPYTKSAYDALFTQTSCQGSAFVTPPVLTISRGKSKSASAFGPLNTISSGGIHSGLVTTESWNSFLASNYNGSICTKHISQEMGALSTKDRHALYNFKTPDIEDCYYRMLKPPEVQRGMAFRDDYVILGSGRHKVKQCGNAVTPPVMKWLMKQAIESLS